MLPAKVNVLGVYVSRTDYDAVVEEVISSAKEGKALGVTALAVHGIMEGFFDGEFAKQLNDLDIVTPDGQPVRWALNLLGAKEVKERVQGPALMLKVCERAALEKIPVFLYGSRDIVLEKSKYNLLNRYPSLVIAGVFADRFREPTPEEDKADINMINSSGARIVFVGRGCPRQEKWIYRHMGKVNAVMIGVGAAFDFHAGFLRQAPKIFQDLGLEWLFRLSQEPKRLWRRYLILNPLFIFYFCLQLMRGEKWRR